MQTVDSDDKKMNKHGLGRGLDALIPTDINDEGKVTATDFISVEIVDPNPHQPRQEFNEVSLTELASSIREHGILQPLLVAPSGGRYQLIAGERRLRAAKIAGLKEVPVVTRTLDEQSKLELALIENVQRENLNPIEAAASYKKLMDEFNLTQDEIARKVGKARPTIANTIRLLSLPVEIKQALAKGKISEGHARTLLGIDDPKKQRDLFEGIISGKITVRQAENKSNRAKGYVGKIKDPNLEAAERKISEALATKVVIKNKAKNKGQIIIDYYNLEDLEKIYKRIIGS